MSRLETRSTHITADMPCPGPGKQRAQPFQSEVCDLTTCGRPHTAGDIRLPAVQVPRAARAARKRITSTPKDLSGTPNPRRAIGGPFAPLTTKITKSGVSDSEYITNAVTGVKNFRCWVGTYTHITSNTYIIMGRWAAKNIMNEYLLKTIAT